MKLNELSDKTWEDLGKYTWDDLINKRTTFMINDSVFVKDNLAEVMRELKFDEDCIHDFCKKFVGTKQKIYDIYTDKDSGEKYATVDLCCEIPTRCLELSK